MASGVGHAKTAASTPSRFRTHKSSTASGSSGSWTEYVCVGIPNEILLENYFLQLSQFQFELARESCDRERDNRTSLNSDNWCDFLSALGRLANAEASYFSLTFGSERGSRVRLLRKETLKSSYELILLELKKIQEVYTLRKGGMDFSWERWMAELMTHITEYVSARKEMIEFYLSFEHSDGFHLNYSKLEGIVKTMNERYKDNFQHALLKPVKSAFQKELLVLGDILQAQRSISEWCLLSAILAIQSCNTTLSNWHGIIPLGILDSTERKQIQKSIRSPPFSPSPVHIPYLYKWWCKFHVVLLAKFTLYFYVVLAEQSCVYDMKYLSDKLDINYMARFWDLIRNTHADCVCLIFDSNDLPDFKGPKYYCPDSPTPSLSGLNSYPFMISVPHDFDFHHHRANIISTVMEKSQQLNASSQCVLQHDEKLHCTYYMVQVEPRVTLVVLSSLGSRGARDKDSKIINWILDSSFQLRNIRIANLLRPV